MISLRRLFVTITILGILFAIVAWVYHRNQLLRYHVGELEKLGVQVAVTSPTGTVLYVEAPGDIRLFSAEELDRERWMIRYALRASFHRKVVRSNTFVNMPTSVLDIELYECQFDGVPQIPHTIQTCIVEEHEKLEDVLIVLDALEGTNVRYLRITYPFAEDEHVILTEKLRKLTSLEILDMTYGDVWYDRQLQPPIVDLPTLRVTNLSQTLLRRLSKLNAIRDESDHGTLDPERENGSGQNDAR